MKIKRYLTLGFCCILAVHLVLCAQPPSQLPGTLMSDLEYDMDGMQQEIQKKKRVSAILREGTVFKNEQGEFHLIGNRVALQIHDGAQRFYCLENLNLDRIVQVMKTDPMMNEWKVDFTITEYGNENFAFINRAVLNRPNISPQTPALRNVPVKRAR